MQHTSKNLLGMTYSQKLATEDWRTFSESIRRERKNACQCCRRTDVVTQVHHICYDPDREPWQADRADVVLLCKACHQGLHDELKKFRRLVFGHLNAQSFRVINEALGIAVTNYEPLIFAHALSEFVQNQRLIENHAKAWGIKNVMRDKVNKIEN